MARPAGSATSWWPPLSAGLLVLVIGLGACGQAPGEGFVDVYNRSPGTVTVEVTESSGGLAIGPSTHAYEVEPWAPGRCLGQIGTGPGVGRVGVFGSNIAQPETVETTVTSERETHVTVEVTADGQVRFGVPLPEQTLPCTGG